MKDILGHKSWNEAEIYDFFDKGSFTMCSLPHYRYQRVQLVCGRLKRCGFIERAGSTETSVNYSAKPEYHQWRKDVAEGNATSSLDKLFKQLHPPKLLTRTCNHCQAKMETFNHKQKFCSKKCKSEANIKRQEIAA